MSTLNLIDLAGSENVNRSRSYEDHSRLQEAKSINKSLLGLGKCISQLAQGGSSVIPYRDSVLTWLLKDALGGNAHTLMLCAVDPSADNAEQTLTTLRYADQAKKIVTRPVENIDHGKRMLRELHEQVAELRSQAETAAKAQAEALALRAEAERAAHEAERAAAEAAAEREAARAAASAATEAAAVDRAEMERWKVEAASREAEAQQREAALREQAAKAAEKAQKAEAQVESAAAKGAKRGSPAKKATGTEGAVLMGAPVVPTMAAADIASTMAAMSREEKLAFAKKLKEERKALYTELGIEEEPKPAKQAAADASNGAVVAPGAAAAPGAAVPASPPPAAFQVAFKCLGFLFTMSVAHETSQESDRSDREGDAKM